MTCLLCGRKLMNQKSQEMGYGPVCYRKVFGRSYGCRRIKDRGGGDGGEDIPYFDIPGEMSIEEYLKSLGNG